MNHNVLLLLLLSSLAAASSSLAKKKKEKRVKKREKGPPGPRLRIVGGHAADEDHYSFAVSLVKKGDHRCGGTLISPDTVVSAAHCFYGEGVLDVVVGRHDIHDKDEKEGWQIRVKKTVVHPGYDDESDDDDVMIMFLGSPVDEDYVKFASVTENYVGAGVNVTAVGWGQMGGYHDDEVSGSADELQEIDLYTITNEECNRARGTISGSRDSYHFEIYNSMMCSASDERKDTCQGDSGGPLVTKKGSGDEEEFELVGIVSWGNECAHDDFPGVYSRVSYLYPWIRKQVCKRSLFPPSNFECGAEGEPSSSDHKIAPAFKHCIGYDGMAKDCMKEGCTWVPRSKKCIAPRASVRGKMGTANH